MRPNPTQHLPESPSIEGTRLHCHVVHQSGPLSNFFGPTVRMLMANLYAELSAFRLYTIPVERRVIIGFNQRIGFCVPETRFLAAIKPGININSILFDSGEYAGHQDTLAALFHYLTEECGWIGMDLPAGVQAQNERSGAASVHNGVLGPDIFKINRLVEWMLDIRKLGQALGKNMEQVDDQCCTALNETLQHALENINSGKYTIENHSRQAYSPITLPEFQKFELQPYASLPSSSPLPKPLPIPGMKVAEPVEQTDVPRGTYETKAKPIGQVLVFDNVDHFSAQVSSMTATNVKDLLKSPANRNEEVTPKLRFIKLRNRPKLFCHVFPIVSLVTHIPNARPSMVLKALDKFKAKNAKSMSDGPHMINTVSIGQNFSCLISGELLLAWARSMVGAADQEGLIDLVCRMDDLQTVIDSGQEGKVIIEGPPLECLEYYETCGCSDEECPEEEVQLVSEEDINTSGGGVWDSPEADKLMEGIEADQIPEELRHTSMDYFEHFRGLHEQSERWMKDEIAKSIKTHRENTDRFLRELHKKIDPKYWAALEAEELAESAEWDNDGQ